MQRVKDAPVAAGVAPGRVAAFCRSDFKVTTRSSFFLLLALLALASCKKDRDRPAEIDFGPGEGISYRDGFNLSAGPADPTD